MKIPFGQFRATYFDSGWRPALVFLLALAGFVLVAALNRPFLGIPAGLLFVAAAVAYLGIVIAVIRNFTCRRWAKGFLNLLALPLCLLTAFAAVYLLVVTSLLGSSEDGFANNLAIPAGLVVAEPLPELEAKPGTDDDTFQRDLLAALAVPGGDDPILVASIDALTALDEKAPDLLRRYLASSPAWRVFTEDGALFATRRWRIGPEWSYNLHGYYSRSDLDMWSKTGTLGFQSRVTLGLSGRPWWRGNENSTWLKAGRSAKAALSEGNQMHQSHCVIATDKLVVELFEQSPARERRLTRAALAHLESELAPLAANPSVETLRAHLPAGAIRRGAASFELRNSFQPGLYDSILWANPGEPGRVYLRAFEVTRGTALSTESLRERSGEWIGWSDDPEELFFSNTHFTIYEGDWGKPYAARFEVWFAPDSGAPRRMLMEKIFKIEGWQR